MNSDNQITKNRKNDSIYKILAFFKKHWISTLSVVLAILSLGICLYYIVCLSKGDFHSDCTDSLYWANATVESGKIFDENFRYAAMLPFSASLWFIPIIKLFGVTMRAQIIGMSVFLVLFTTAIWFMCRSMNWSVRATCSMISALLLILSGSEKLREIMWGHVIYYSLALLIICVGTGLVFRFEKHFAGLVSSAKKKKSIAGAVIFGALTALLFAGNATNGFQMIAIATVPVLAGIFAERFFDGRQKLFSSSSIPAAVMILTVIVSTLCGLVILKLLKGEKAAGYTSVYSMFSGISDWYGNFTKLFSQFPELIGISIKKSDRMISKEAIVYLIRLAGMLVITVIPLVGLFGYKKLHDKGTRFVLWVHLSLTAVILFGYICGRISNANWRLTPIIGSSVMATVAIFREWLDGIFPKKSTDEAENNEKCSEKRVCFRLGVILSAVIVMFGAVNFNEIRKMPRDYEHPLEAVANDLEAHGLEYGYATFWRSQALTMLSDSKVRVRETLVKSDGVITDYYQSSRLWYEDQPGIDKYFIMLSDDELNTVGDSEYWQEITEKYLIENFETRGYNVFVFNRNVILKGTFGS
ncbi:MAG: hypothetical protein SOZ78_04205 [Eubacteriales bacterium]|nr:hypothetical protein [Eubacteriales bacterium]